MANRDCELARKEVVHVQDLAQLLTRLQGPQLWKHSDVRDLHLTVRSKELIEERLELPKCRNLRIAGSTSTRSQVESVRGADPWSKP